MTEEFEFDDLTHWLSKGHPLPAPPPWPHPFTTKEMRAFAFGPLPWRTTKEFYEAAKREFERFYELDAKEERTPEEEAEMARIGNYYGLRSRA